MSHGVSLSSDCTVGDVCVNSNAIECLATGTYEWETANKTELKRNMRQSNRDEECIGNGDNTSRDEPQPRGRTQMLFDIYLDSGIGSLVALLQGVVDGQYNMKNI